MSIVFAERRQWLTCSEHDELLKCMYERFKTQCNEDVARVFTKFQYVIDARGLSYYNCTIDTDYLSGFSRLSMTSLVLLLPLLSLMFVGH